MKTDGTTRQRTVAELLFAQYNSIQREYLVVTTSMRILWFVLLLVLALIPELKASTFTYLLMILWALAFISMLSRLRILRLESAIRNSLVRLDIELQDYYIRSSHEAKRSASPFARYVFRIPWFEDMVWVSVSMVIGFMRTMS